MIICQFSVDPVLSSVFRDEGEVREIIKKDKSIETRSIPTAELLIDFLT